MGKKERPYWARKIVELRDRQGLSGGALAKLSGLGTTTIADIERGESSPSLTSLEAIAKALGVGVYELLKDEPAKSIALTMPNDLSAGFAFGTSFANLPRDTQLLVLGLVFGNVAGYLSLASPEYIEHILDQFAELQKTAQHV
jgi:transcriptional regulator with XRE-family HTH domain